MAAPKTREGENTKAWWNARYEAANPLYETSPSVFVMENLQDLSHGLVFDVACGEGRNAIALAKQGLRVEGMDWSEAAIDRANTRAETEGGACKANVEFKAKDLDFFLPELMKYEALVMVNFRPPLQFVKNVARGLKQNGLLLVEAFLTSQCRDENRKGFANDKEIQALEMFECFKPNELLGHVKEFQILYYNEKPQGGRHKVYCLAKKTGLI